MAANGQRLRGVGRVCQELEALSASLYGCWMAAGWRKSEAARRWRVANQGCEEGRGARFSADAQMVLVLAAITRAVGRCVYEQQVPVLASLRGDEIPGFGSSMSYLPTPASRPGYNV